MKRDGAAVCVFAIYDCPRDYPNHVVIRGWQVGPDKTLIPWDEPTLFDVTSMGHRAAMAAARKSCRRLGLDFEPRTKGDDPVIVEKWKGQPRAVALEADPEHVGAVLKTPLIS